MSFGTDTSEKSEFLRGVEVGKKERYARLRQGLISRLTTQELIDELCKREGVEKHYIEKMNTFKIYRGGARTPFWELVSADGGEATILVVKKK